MTGTKQFIWSENQMAEAINGETVTAQYFGDGQTIMGLNYFYSTDHLGSIRELTDINDTVMTSYYYNMYGAAASNSGSPTSDMQYAGYYFHAPSKLNSTTYRAYSSSLGRFLTRDPIDENGGINLYAYVENSPICQTDPFGEEGMGDIPNYPFVDPINSPINRSVGGGALVILDPESQR